MIVQFTIFGQPVSMKNRRELVTIHRGTPEQRNLWIMSEEAKAYEASALKQIPPLHRLRLEGPVRVTLRLFYTSQRSDMDEALILDVLQDRWKKVKQTGERVLIQSGVYRNDRQVRERHVFHGIDKANPRAEVVVEPMVIEQQAALALPALADDDDPFA